MKNEFTHEFREAVLIDDYLRRIAMSLKTKTIVWRARGWNTAADIAASLLARVVELRKHYQREIERAARELPIIQSASGIYGVSPLMVARIVVEVDIEKCDTVAALWRYFGQGVVGGMADPAAAVHWPRIITYNERARRSLAQLRIALLRRASPYRRIYDARKKQEIARGLPRMRAHLRAARYTVKLWLKHLWLVWRRQEGLPLGQPHPEDTTFLAAEFGWR